MRRVEAVVVEPVVTVPRADPPPAARPAAAPSPSNRLRTGIRAGWVAYTDDGST